MFGLTIVHVGQTTVDAADQEVQVQLVGMGIQLNLDEARGGTVAGRST